MSEGAFAPVARPEVTTVEDATPKVTHFFMRTFLDIRGIAMDAEGRACLMIGDKSTYEVYSRRY